MLLVLLQGCSVMRLGDSLSRGVLEHDDLELVGEGLPTWLLMIDGMIVNWPESESLLRSGASLYSAYAGLYVDDEERAQRLVQRAMDYATRAACAHHRHWCDAREMSMDEFDALLARSDEDELPILYTLGTTWVSFIQLHSSDWNAVAELGRVEAIMKRVVELEPGWEHGQAHMYLGALNSILPASLGGQPEQAREHFEQAIALSEGRNLMAKVLYAERYARLVFDQALHDRLLNDVLAADPQAGDLTLQNRYARQEARRLLAGSAEYFE